MHTMYVSYAAILSYVLKPQPQPQLQQNRNLLRSTKVGGRPNPPCRGAGCRTYSAWAAARAAAGATAGATAGAAAGAAAGTAAAENIDANPRPHANVRNGCFLAWGPI